jgi:hypothetical protein
VSVDVGIFSLRLGEPPNMIQLLAGDLVGATDPVLRVWVNTGTGFEQLPDQPLSRVHSPCRASRRRGPSRTSPSMGSRTFHLRVSSSTMARR